MASYNRVILVGNLTRDPELSHTASNTAVCKFGMATNRRWRDRNTGEDREEVCFVDCVCFGRGGEVINQYMGKGRPMLVEGHLRYSQWEDQNGNKRSKLEVSVENFTFLGGGQGGGGQSPRPAGAGQRASAGAPRGPQGGGMPDQGYGGSSPGEYGGHDDDYGPPVDDDNVPF